MKKNYRNKYTGQQIEAHFYVKGVKKLIDEMFLNSGVEWQFYADENIYEFEQRDEYGFTTTQVLALGDYIVWDGDYLKIYTPQRFADVYQIIPVNGIPEVLTGVEEPTEEPERHSEGFRKWVGTKQFAEKQDAPSQNFLREKTEEESTFKNVDKSVIKDWYSDQTWWDETRADRIAWDDVKDFFAGAERKPYVDPYIKSVEAYRITEQFDEWEFINWLTPGDKFTATYCISKNSDGYPRYSDPVIAIYSPKTEGKAKVGDLIIKVCPHRYTIQACVPEEKEVD